MPTPARTASPASDLLPGFWIETPHRQVLPHRIDQTRSRWWERLTRLATYEVVTSAAGYGLFYSELRIRYPKRSGTVRWSFVHRRYAALCGGATGVSRFLTELRRQGVPVREACIAEVARSVHGSSERERWPGLILEGAGA